MGKARLRLVIFVVSFYATTLLASPSRLSFVSFTSPIRVSNTTTSEIDVDTSEQDGIYMRRAIELATRALGKTSPNPCVGCVIVKDGVVIGEGWHEKAGEPHAEVYALRSAGENAKGATAYVSLEPCNHYGRTPPCTLALLNNGIRRVVAGMVDPDPRVSGNGLKLLQRNGVSVTVDVEGKACRDTNAPFVFRVLHKRAYAAALTAVAVADAATHSSSASHTTIADVHRWGSSLPSLPSLLAASLSEVDTILLDSDQFCAFKPQDVPRLPPHLKIAIIARGDCDYNKLLGLIKTAAEGGLAVSRRWFLLHGNSIHLSAKGQSVPPDVSDFGAVNVAVVELPLLGSANEVSGSLDESDEEEASAGVIFAALEKLVSLGSNAAVFIARSRDQLKALYGLQALQKLVIVASDELQYYDSTEETGVDVDVNRVTDGDTSSDGHSISMNASGEIISFQSPGNSSKRVDPSASMDDDDKEGEKDDSVDFQVIAKQLVESLVSGVNRGDDSSSNDDYKIEATTFVVKEDSGSHSSSLDSRSQQSCGSSPITGGQDDSSQATNDSENVSVDDSEVIDSSRRREGMHFNVMVSKLWAPPHTTFTS